MKCLLFCSTSIRNSVKLILFGPNALPKDVSVLFVLAKSDFPKTASIQLAFLFR
jgi:hypothetical protein